MEYLKFLNKVVDEGIESAKIRYTKRKNQDFLEGAVRGFEACRNLRPEDLADLLKTTSDYVKESRMKRLDNYWFFRAYQAEVEWVVNVVGAALVVQGKDPLVEKLTTEGGKYKAQSILGIEKLEL